jgi:hypothetical protein
MGKLVIWVMFIHLYVCIYLHIWVSLLYNIHGKFMDIAFCCIYKCYLKRYLLSNTNQYNLIEIRIPKKFSVSFYILISFQGLSKGILEI